MTTLAALNERFQNEGFSHALAADVEAAVVARRTQAGEHRDWALLCEQIGLMSLAFNEFQLALRDDRDDPVAGFHLAELYRERGDTSRALGLLDRLLQQEPANETWLDAYVEILAEEGGTSPLVDQVVQQGLAHGLSPASADRLRRAARPGRSTTVTTAPSEPEAELTPSDADCVRFHTLFAGREGVYARQWVRSNGQGGYTPVHEPLTPAVIRNHLLGSFTAGVYPIRLDGTATFFAVDLDIDKQALQRARGEPAYAQQLRDTLRVEGPRLLNVLVELGFAPLFENSGYKGRHYWVLLEEPETADVLHLLGRMLLAWQSPQLAPGLHLEFFPKQASVKSRGLGNLIKLPLGIHRRTGRRSQLLDDQGTALADPLAALRAVRRCSRATLYAAIERLKAQCAANDPPATVPFPGAPSEQPETMDETPDKRLPPAPPPAPAWTEADFETDPPVRQLLAQCPVLAELKRTADEHRRLSHEEQLVLIHTLGHLEGGPHAVNYLFDKCIDVGPEKRMKDRLKGNPVSCPSIRKKIPHITRRLPCNCPFEFAPDRYPTPVLHLLTLPADERTPAPAAPSDALLTLAQRFGVIERQQAEIQLQWQELRRSLMTALAVTPNRTVEFEHGRYRLIENEGVEELVWQEAVEQESEDEAAWRA